MPLYFLYGSNFQRRKDSQGEYTDGKKLGKWTFYNSEGQVVKEEDFSK
jgi:hypothetical protein